MTKTDRHRNASPGGGRMKKEDFRPAKIFTIPNFLSLFRLILAVVFWYVYTHARSYNEVLIAVFVLVISGLTDILDGQIARRFDSVSELGKILDPIADKVTQLMILISLLERFPLILFALVLFVLKQTYLSIAGIVVLKRTKENHGARWFGKMNTVILYFCSILMILYYDMPLALGNALILVCCLSIVTAFILYVLEYQRILKKTSL